MNKISRVLFVLIVLLSATSKIHAEELSVVLTVRDGETVVFTGDVPLSDGDNVLSMLNNADAMSEDFEISEIQDFPFGKYLKCITYINGERCDNWQYVVDGTSPYSSIDQTTLSGGENVYVYFGPQNRVTLSSNSISTSDTLTVTTENYDYENNDWSVRDGVTAGITQPNPSDPFNPTEILTTPVDGNGQAVFSSIPAGSYNVGIKEDFYFPTEPLTVTAPASSGGGSSGSKSSSKPKEGSVLGVETKAKFDVKKAFEFLAKQQKENGSFGEDIYTDWVTVALASGDNQEQVIKLIKYLVLSKTEGSLLTDYERRAIALMSLGLNPYNTNGENYIKKITDSFDGKQFGDINEDNDDIFALIVLHNAGFLASESNISSSIDFVLSRQRENGSWDESIDMTGAGIQALSNFSENEKIKNALEKAKEYLKENQKNDGGWSNASSTAWAIGGIIALKENPEDWKQGDNTPFSYLATNQDVDGAVKNSSTEEDQKIKNKIWETGYATVAYSGKTWNEIMQKFEKPKESIENPVLEASTVVKKVETKATPKKIVKEKVETESTPKENNIPKLEPEKEIKQENWFMRLINFIF